MGQSIGLALSVKLNAHAINYSFNVKCNKKRECVGKSQSLSFTRLKYSTLRYLIFILYFPLCHSLSACLCVECVAQWHSVHAHAQNIHEWRRTTSDTRTYRTMECEQERGHKENTSYSWHVYTLRTHHST